MSTATSSDVYVTLRNRVLGFTDGVTTVASLIGTGDAARLYQDDAPDVAVYPYATMRIVNDTTSTYRERSTADLEIQVYDRPRSQTLRSRLLADLIDGALLTFMLGSSTGGFIRVTGRSRSRLPAGSGDADAEVVSHRLLYGLLMWPVYLTKYGQL